MKFGLCKRCGKLATRTCTVCGASVCIECIEPYGCKLCMGKKEKDDNK